MGVSVSPSVSPSASVSPSVSPSKSPSASPSVSPSVSISPSMSPSPADLIYPPTQNGLQKTLGAQLDTGAVTSATLNNTTGIQNKKGLFVVDRVDSGGTEKDASLREYITFDNVSGSTVTGLTRGLGGTTGQDHAVGAVVEFVMDVVQEQALIDTFLVGHGTSGVHAANVVTTTATQTLTNKTITSLVNSGAITIPTGTDTLVGKSTTDTLTNKRITKRVTTITSSSAPTINTDNCDVVTITAQAEAISSMTTNLSGTPTNFQTLVIRIKDDGTARAITWGAKFVAKGVALPTTTVISKLLTVGFIYDTVLATWGCVASVQEV